VCDHEKITSMDTEEGNSVEKSLKTQWLPFFIRKPYGFVSKQICITTE
jgi:hypothetical protein